MPIATHNVLLSLVMRGGSSGHPPKREISRLTCSILYIHVIHRWALPVTHGFVSAYSSGKSHFGLVLRRTLLPSHYRYVGKYTGISPIHGWCKLQTQQTPVQARSQFAYLSCVSFHILRCSCFSILWNSSSWGDHRGRSQCGRVDLLHDWRWWVESSIISFSFLVIRCVSNIHFSENRWITSPVPQCVSYVLLVHPYISYTSLTENRQSKLLPRSASVRFLNVLKK